MSSLLVALSIVSVAAVTAWLALVSVRLFSSMEPRPVRRLGRWGGARLPSKYRAWVHRQWVKAGESDRIVPEDIWGCQGAAVAAGCLVALSGRVWGLALGAGLVLLPVVWLSQQVTQRHGAIRRVLPHHLDLLTLLVEAGLDLGAALSKVVDSGTGGPFREELRRVLQGLKLGRTREEAFREMARRVELAPLSLFVAALVQADRMGTPLGKVLRAQARQLRAERAQRAETLAQQASVKLLLPLVACIFPTVFLILFGPILFGLVAGHLAG